MIKTLISLEGRVALVTGDSSFQAGREGPLIATGRESAIGAALTRVSIDFH